MPSDCNFIEQDDEIFQVASEPIQPQDDDIKSTPLRVAHKFHRAPECGSTVTDDQEQTTR